jgi:hypothetical protein
MRRDGKQLNFPSPEPKVEAAGLRAYSDGLSHGVPHAQASVTTDLAEPQG